MAIFFHGSSGQTLIAPPAPVMLPGDTGAAASALDEALPETRPFDRIRLLIQSPRKLYLYWELAHDPFIALSQSVGAAQAASYKLAVRLTSVDDGAEHLREANTQTRGEWFDVFPGNAYKADIGLFAQGRAFIRLLSSNTVRTPRASVSSLIETSPEFRVAPMDFARVLDKAGYASDALEVALEAVDDATHNKATREIFAGFGDDEAFAANEFDPAEMRALIVALAFGVPFDSMQPTLSPALARWIEDTRIARGILFDSARALELLHSVLRFELVLSSFAFADEDMRRAARFDWSGSRVNLPTFPAHIWLPSMALRSRRS